MSTQTERHDLREGLYIYLQNNSTRWYARFSLDGKWYAKATKTSDFEQAKEKAFEIYTEHKIKFENGIPVKTHKFKDIANETIAWMQNQFDNGGKKSYRDYIQALNRYHIPFFDNTHITNIDQKKIEEFNKWREGELGRKPAKSTLLNHNAAFNMVFKKAIENKWMMASQVPALDTDGEQGKRRAPFSADEYDKLRETIEQMVDDSRTEKTRQIRELLLSYMDFSLDTGIRTGTEMASITWGDISMERQNHNVRFFVKITKGKTIKHTGTRTIVCSEDIDTTIATLRDRFPNRKPNDKVFVLLDGSETSELGPTFSAALKKCGLKDSADGPRALYSLRHTYITWQLKSREIRIDILAKQCGTSVAMIEKHYSHIVPSAFAKELSGVEFDTSQKAEKSKGAKKTIEKTQKQALDKYILWEKESKVRGCL